MITRKWWLLALSFTCALFTFGQTTPLKAFEQLAGYKWISEGQQLSGTDGKTLFEIDWGLHHQIVKVKTHITDPKTGNLELRNEGISAFNKATGDLEFYEFDKLGGITTGTVLVENRNVHYEYVYEGLQLRDSWIYLSDSSYQLIIGVWQNDDWSKKYLETTLSKL